ncbi:hypothetical protein GCM10023083_76440 [Streptomyces phyllanthi]
MIRSRPGSVVEAARTWSTPSMNAVRRGGAGSGPPGGTGGAYADCRGTAGTVGAARTGGAALPFDVSVT